MCRCIAKINKSLAPYNCEITVNLLDPSHTFVETNKIDPKKRGKLPLLIPSYCPFCGEKHNHSAAVIAA